MKAISGLMLAGGGVATLVVNAVLTPMLPPDASGAPLMGSPYFSWRLGLAAAGAFLLLAGMLGLQRVGWFANIAFAIAFLGTAMLFAHEWAQVFFMHDLALIDPEALERLDDTTMWNAEAIATVVMFMLGWVLLSVAMLLTKGAPRFGPALVIAGFIAIPALGMAVPGIWGQIAGNVVLSSGWIVLGLNLLRPARA